MSVPRFEPLSIERFVIRPIRADDVEPLWRRRNDPSTAEFQHWTLPYPRERAQALVDEMVGHDAQLPSDGWMQLAIDDADSGSVIGDLAVGLSFGGRSAELGWTVDADQRGRGVASEATSALAAWLFETVGVTRISAMTHPENTASVRIAERLGMVFEGHTRNSYWVGEENSDDWLFGMTPEMWRAWVDRPRHRAASVRLVPITSDNLAAVERLATHRSQEHLVAPVAGSFADAFVAMTRADSPVVPWCRAAVADGDVAGFVMVREPTDAKRNGYLWRLLIDRMHQRRGIGTTVVEQVADHVRSMGASALTVSWVPGPGSPEPMYLRCGFVPTGEIHDGEVVARLDLA